MLQQQLQDANDKLKISEQSSTAQTQVLAHHKHKNSAHLTCQDLRLLQK
jgi:hypothetical protein